MAATKDKESVIIKMSEMAEPMREQVIEAARKAVDQCDNDKAIAT